MDSRYIGVLDSGVGGISVLKELVKELPNENYLFYGDSLNAPYGTKTKEEVYTLTKNIVDKMINAGVKAIVIACNTATSIAIEELRKQYTIPLIGIEPAIKPAANENINQDVLVLATPRTLKSDRLIRLVNEYNDKAHIILKPMPGLADIVENGKLDNVEIMDYLNIMLKDYINNPPHGIVLGCTHYPFVKKQLQELFPNAKFYDGAVGVSKQLHRKLQEFDLLNKSNNPGHITFESSKNTTEELTLYNTLYNYIKSKH